MKDLHMDEATPGLVGGAPSVDLGAFFKERIEMTAAEWAAIPDNPIQRNTELHARRAKHLRNPSPFHRFVDMAVLPDGTRFKIDGHTRSWLWEQRQIPIPETVIVDCWSVPDVNAVELLYGHRDNPMAAETSVEQLTGAVKLYGLDFETAFLRAGQFGSGLKRAYFHVKGQARPEQWRELPLTFAAIEMFQEELMWLDGLGPVQRRWPGGLITGFLVTMRRAGEAGLEFWQAYSDNKGVKMEGRMDAVQALSEEVLGLNPHRSRLKQTQETLYVRTIGAYLGWCDKTTYSMGLRNPKPETVRNFARGQRGKLVRGSGRVK